MTSGKKLALTWAILIILAGIYLICTPVIQAVLSGPKDKKVLLTFDDGPHPVYTPLILNILREKNIKAIFFVIGREAEKHPELLRAIVQEGHVIGNHTYTHQNITTMNPAELIEELKSTDEVIYQITGQKTIYFRPPRGKYNFLSKLIIHRNGKVLLLWDAGLEKNNIDEPYLAVKNLTDRINRKGRAIILMHDGDPSNLHDRTLTVMALPSLIDYLESNGWVFINPSTPEGIKFLKQYAR